MVLEALSPRAPYGLENRTSHLLLWRPLAAPGAAFAPLPPYSAAGFAPPTTATPHKVKCFADFSGAHSSDSCGASCRQGVLLKWESTSCNDVSGVMDVFVSACVFTAS